MGDPHGSSTEYRIGRGAGRGEALTDFRSLDREGRTWGLLCRLWTRRRAFCMASVCLMVCIIRRISNWI